VTKTIIKKQGVNINLFDVDEGEGLAEHSSPLEALVQLLEDKAEFLRLLVQFITCKPGRPFYCQQIFRIQSNKRAI